MSVRLLRADNPRLVKPFGDEPMIPFKTLAGSAAALVALAASPAVSAQTVLTLSSWVPPTRPWPSCRSSTVTG